MLSRFQFLPNYMRSIKGIPHTSLDMENLYHWTSSTMVSMPENELYLGNTINIKSSENPTRTSKSWRIPGWNAWCLKILTRR